MRKNRRPAAVDAAVHVTFHFDPGCPWTWLTSRWLVRLAEAGVVELRWAPFSLAHLNEGGEVPERYRPMVAAGRVGTRVVSHLADAGDHDAIGRFYAAWGDATFRAGSHPSVEAVDVAARAAGLSDAALAAGADESLDAAVDAATDAAMDLVGPDVGSPVLTWTDPERGDQAIFGPIIERVPAMADARLLWEGVRALAALGEFKELKRGRRAPPALADS